MIYDPTNFGAIGDGSVANADLNTAAFQKMFDAAANVAGPIVVPMCQGFVINNGQLVMSAPNMVIRGEGGMGASDSAPTSRIIGHGPGDTLLVTAPGCRVEGLAINANVSGEQKGNDAFIKVTHSQVMLSDLFMRSPNIGISMQLPWAVGGEFWVENLLIGGVVGTAGIIANAGNAAVQMRHVLMYADDPQPFYGIAVTSAGELLMSDCDVDNMGTCLALIPGMDAGRPQNVSAVFINNCLFDNGNGPGCVFVQPKGSAFVQDVYIVNSWASTINNNGGKWSTDGFHFDGTQSTPVGGVRPITAVNMSNCHMQNFQNHDGIYAVGVTGLSVIGCTAGGCYNGIQIGGPTPNMACSGTLVGNKFGNYVSPPLAGPVPFSGGNSNYGVLIQKSPLMAVALDNKMDGNGRGSIVVLP